MLQAKWPEDALRWPSCRPEKNKAGTQYIWGGLRVRCGIHFGLPTCNVDPTTGRMDYLGSQFIEIVNIEGPVVNKASRVSQMAAGGQILVSTEFWDEVRLKFTNRDIEVKDIGNEYVIH